MGKHTVMQIMFLQIKQNVRIIQGLHYPDFNVMHEVGQFELHIINLQLVTEFCIHIQSYQSWIVQTSTSKFYQQLW